MQMSAYGIFVYIDYIIATVRNNIKEALVYSCFDRSEIAVRGFTANISKENVILYTEDEKECLVFKRMDTNNFLAKLMNGKEEIHHGVCISKEINKKVIITNKQNRNKDIYNYFMNNFDLPLLKEWIPYLLEKGKNQITELEILVYGKKPEWFNNAIFYEISMENSTLQELLKNGLKKGIIKISEKEQKPLEFQNMNDYFMKYGNSLIENLEKKLNPLVELKNTVEEIAFLEKRFYPQQAAITNGVIAAMNYSNYCFINEDMGCGKTLQGIGILEGFFHKKIMEQQKKNIKDIYLDPNLVKYRNIIMCPSHLVEKWKESILADIAYAKVIIIKGLNELSSLKKQGKERIGKEYYLLSKETGKLSYTYKPSPTQYKKKNVAMVECKDCGYPRPISMPKQCQCGSINNWHYVDYGYQDKGMICPECNQLLFPADQDTYIPNEEKRPLQSIDFCTQTKANRICRHCGSSLWIPACKTINTTFLIQTMKQKKEKWVKITHYANKAKRNKKTVWVYKPHQKEYMEKNELLDKEVSYPKVVGVRKYALSRYIKKYLKGFFDFAIFDEAHEYKGGTSAQGMSMHDLVLASKWQLPLTGTISGGYANHLFYLLYRLNPGKMKNMGYIYGAEGERKFIEDYGTLATEYAVEQDDNGNYNSRSRGRMLGSPKCLPGISLRIYTDFLLDKAVFLSLSDMSSFLPPLKEYIEHVPLEDEIYSAYSDVRDKIKKAMVEKELGKSMLGSLLQFSLSYTDKPYARNALLSPADGQIIAEVPDLSYLIEDKKLLNKEKKLCELIRKEQKQDRNIFVFCTYTGLGEANITGRLKEIIIENCEFKSNEVEIIESSNPPAQEREEWMHKRAAKGVRIFITNPKCVKTGLDFAFTYNGVAYNFPTIIFFQYDYELITMWQASKRHHRLNQTKECHTYYILSDRTIQVDALEMIASKQVATSAIQGKFSSEGLSAMAQGVDPKIKLAQAAAETEKSQKNIQGLQSMFDVLNKWNTKMGKQKYNLMPTFSELTGLETKKAILPTCEDEFLNKTDLFKVFLDSEVKEDDDEKIVKEKNEIEQTSLLHSFFIDFNCLESYNSKQKKMKQKTLFDL